MKTMMALLISGSQLTLAASVAAAEPESPSADSGPGDAGEAAHVDSAEQPSLSYGAELDVTSRYMSRGLAWSERPVLQPSARVADHGVTLGVGGNVYLIDETASASGFSELDLSTKYDLVLGRTTFSPSLSAYIYPEESDTAELGATLSYDLELLTLQTRHALDVLDNAGGWYGDFGAFRSQPLGSRVTLETTASMAWCSGSFGRYYVDESLRGMHFGAAILDSSLMVLATEAVYFRLHGTLSRMLEQRIRDSAGDDVLFGGGLALGIAR
jgi:hypothetical protein